MKNFFLFFISLFCLLGANSAQAFSISPLRFTNTIAPGDSQDWEIKVVNDSDHQSIFHPLIIGMKQDNLGRSIFGKNIDVAENWFKTPLGDVTLAPGASAKLIFSVNIPLNTPPGAHYLGLAVQEKNGQTLSAQLATILNLQISGKAQESLAIEKLFDSKDIFFDKNWSAQMQIRNTGNVGIDLIGQENLYYFNQKFSQKFLNFGNNLFAQSVRNANLDLFVSGKIILPGFYRADVNIVFGITHQTVVGSVGFWYLPYWFLIILGVIIFIAIFFVFKKNKNVAV